MEKTKTFDRGIQDPWFYAHDMYNMICLPFISLFDIVFLYYATNWNEFGTGAFGLSAPVLCSWLWSVFTAYIVIDSPWISWKPHIAPSGARVVLIHHVVVIMCLALPSYAPFLTWPFAVALLNEISTAFVTLRRNMKENSFMHHAMHYGLIITWFPIRVGMYPALCLYIGREYLRISQESSNYLNVYLLAFSSQVFLTYLGFSWSVDFARKLLKPKNS